MTENQPYQSNAVGSQPEVTPIITEKRQKPWLVIGLSVLLILSLGSTVYLSYQNNQLRKELQVKPKPISTKNLTLTQTPSPGYEEASPNKSFPGIPGAYMKCKVEGAKSSKILVEIKFENDYSYYDFEFGVSIEDNEGLVGLAGMPPERTYAEAHVTAISEDGRRSETFVVNNREFWEKVAETEKEYAIEHTFVIQ